MKRVARAIGGALSALVPDVFGLVGMGLAAYGFWLVYVPLGFIVGGILLIAGAWLLARGRG